MELKNLALDRRDTLWEQLGVPLVELAGSQIWLPLSSRLGHQLADQLSGYVRERLWERCSQEQDEA